MAAVPFAGDAAAAEAFLRGAVPAIADHPDGGWQVTPAVGSPLRAQLVGEHLVFRRLGDAQGEPPSPTPWLLRGLPDHDGCAVFIDAPDGVLDGLPPTTAAALLPVQAGDDLRVRVASQGQLPAAFARQSPAVAGWGSSTPAPAAVLRLNVPGLEVLAVPAIAANLGLGPEDHAALASVLYVEPGLTVAGFGTKDMPQVAATMGVLRPSGRAFSGAGLNRRIVRMLRELGLPSQKLGRRAFAVDMGGTRVYGAADTGRLAVGTDPVVVAEALVGLGAPWVSPAFAEFSEGRPVALTVNDAVVTGGLQAGLRSTDRTWDLTVKTGGPPVAALDTFVALASPAYVGLRSQARAAEVERMLPALMAAQEDHRARTGHYLALPPSPRPLGLLSTKAVSWVGGPGWDELEFAPDQGLRGTYWVEIDEGGGVLVHGAIDADGDGQPALWVLDVGGLAGPKTE